MFKIKYFIALFLVGLFVTSASAYKPFVPEEDANNNQTTNNSTTPSYRMDCNESTSQTDLNINNVRARLLGGGDMWWDFDDARYVVPNVSAGSGEPEVSSIFAGAIWLGGFDDGNNLKMAAQTYRSSTRNDLWPGPLEPVSGDVTEEECQNWDKHFEVRGAIIETHIKDFRSGNPVDCDAVAPSLKGWPGRGNPHFAGIHGFQLPNQSLAPFFDVNGDDIYDPCDGDFPIIEVIGCEAGELGAVSYADQMIWYVFNDNGGIHTSTTGDPIRMEVHTLAFAYKTGDEVNDMTFYRYKLINRANQSIDSTFFGQWVDADLGCFTDDLIGADTSRSLMYIYNDGPIDGQGGCGSVPTYGNNVPMLGVDYFRGPKDENGKELGMSSFVYYANGGFPGLPGTSDPNTGQQFYNYLSGSWRDGTPFTVGGDAYEQGGAGTPTRYVFPDAPDNPNGWSMCVENIDGADLRTVQASGPFRLDPGAVNELIIGVTWVPDILYPCPNLGILQTADDLAQALYDNCFDITDGPDAPDIDIVELNKELIVLLSYDSTSNTNNYALSYEERDLQAPEVLPTNGQPNTDTNYVFEGYKVYQLESSTFSDIDDPAQARLIFQVDLDNGVDRIYNWKPFPGEVANVPVYSPELMVDGADKGISSSFKVTEDQFAEGDRALVNHKQYYFVAFAYAYNNWLPWDPTARIGQRNAYLVGRRNVEPTLGIPRNPSPEFGGIVVNANYGDGFQITRLDGVGNGGNFLDLTEETVENILGSADSRFSTLVYENGRGPINAKTVDPLRLYPGTYTLTMFDDNMNDAVLDNAANWMLEDPDGLQWFSEVPIDRFNEQIIQRRQNGESVTRGFSLTIGQVEEPGIIPIQEGNGFIGGEEVYADGANPWYVGIAPNSNFLGGAVGYVATGPGDPEEDRDPDQVYSNVLNGAWVPFTLTTTTSSGASPYFLSPMWQNSAFGTVVKNATDLADLQNVDIVYTSDKSKWSRCVVVETASNLHTSEGWTTVGGAKNLELRESPSVDKDGNDDGSGTVGMGWFPGYAIDVETGERLNIFFGENSIYREDQFPSSVFTGLAATGADMLWNPSSNLVTDADNSGNISGIFELPFGEQHYVYVTRTRYDECAEIFTKLSAGNIPNMVAVYRDVIWTSFPTSAQGTQLESAANGIITNDATFKLRVNNPYEVADPVADNNGYPKYQFTIDGEAPQTGQTDVAASALDLINAVPNPYYAYSSYEIQEIDNTIKIVNLPAECTITIYSLDGRFIRQYKRAENGNNTTPTKGSVGEQMSESVNWDLKNSKGIPVASGVYLIHVDAPGLGQRVIKWFGINRTFDTSGL